MRRVVVPDRLSEIARVVLLEEIIWRMDIGNDLKSGFFINFPQYIQDLLGMDMPLFLRIAAKSSVMHQFMVELMLIQVVNYTIKNPHGTLAYSCVGS